MSEAPASAGQDRVVVNPPHREEEEEENKEEMAAATVGERSFLPLKRKVFSHHGDEELTKYHRSKRFVSEEMMAAHLQHLKLSSEGSAWGSGPHHNTLPYPCHLNIKTVASCPQSMDSHLSRKRPLPEAKHSTDAEELDQDIADDPEEWAPSDIKKTRMDLDCTTEAYVSNCAKFKSDSKVVHAVARPEHQHDGGLALHVAGNISDLSSIPEEGEPLTHQTSVDSTDKKSDSNVDTLDTSDSDVDATDTDSHISVSGSMPSSLPLSLPPLSFESGDKVCSVWLAPELKAIKTHADFPLPLSILKEIDSRGMEVVPWVGGLHSLLKDGSQQQEEKGSRKSRQDSSATEDESSMEMN